WEEGGVGEVVEAGAAVLLGHQRAEKAERAELGDDVVGELVPRVVGRDLIAELRLREIAGDVTHLLLLEGQVEVHAALLRRRRPLPPCLKNSTCRSRFSAAAFVS